MAAQTVSVSVGIQWTPPFAAPNSGNSTLNMSAQYNAQSVGNVDIAGATPPATVIPIPLGTITQCKVLVIKNMMSGDIGVRINGAVADNFQVAPGAMISVFMSQAPSANPVSAVSVVTKSTPGSTEQISFHLFGD